MDLFKLGHKFFIPFLDLFQNFQEHSEIFYGIFQNILKLDCISLPFAAKIPPFAPSPTLLFTISYKKNGKKMVFTITQGSVRLINLSCPVLPLQNDPSTFLVPCKRDLFSVRYCTVVYTSVHFLQGTRTTRPCLLGRVVGTGYLKKTF